MSHKFHIHSEVEVLFNVEKFNKDGAVWESGWFHNLILDVGLDKFLSEYIDQDLDNLNIGTGSSNPSTSQTGLDTFLLSTDHELNSNNNWSKVSTNPLVIEGNASGTFSIGNFSGENITELGLSWYDDTYLNRQLIRNLVAVSESVATGDGSTKQFTYIYSSPLEPETISITDGTQVITDDGYGNLTGDVDSSGNNTVDYDNGNANFTLASAPGGGVSITTDYEWWESTSVTVLSDEGLKVYIKMRVLPWFGEAETYTYTGSFSFDDQVSGSTFTVGYTAQLVDDPDDLWGARFGNFNGTPQLEFFDDAGSSITSVGPTSSTFTNAGSNGGVARVEWTFQYDPPSYDGLIGAIKRSSNYNDGHPFIYFDFDTNIEKREQDRVSFTVVISWGRHYGTS